MMAMLLFIGTSELLLIGALVLLLFGGKKLPEMMRGLGQGVKAFKDGMNEAGEKGYEETQRQETSVEEEKQGTEHPHDDGQR